MFSFIFSTALCLLCVSLCRLQSCLLTPFKGINAKATGFYLIIFDAVYASLILYYVQALSNYKYNGTHKKFKKRFLLIVSTLSDYFQQSC